MLFSNFADRCVHVRLVDGTEIVRYARAGKWYIERPDTLRAWLSVSDAASWALEPGADVFTGRPGGRMFDAAVRRLWASQGL